MADDNALNYVELAERIYAACRAVSQAEKLTAIVAAWLMLAAQARTDALAEPGGFPAERARQVELLEAMATVIRTDEPDLEAERLFQEGDVAGLRQRFLDRLRAADEDVGGDDRGGSAA